MVELVLLLQLLWSRRHGPFRHTLSLFLKRKTQQKLRKIFFRQASTQAKNHNLKLYIKKLTRKTDSKICVVLAASYQKFTASSPTVT
eukprot:g23671.t1